MTALSLVGLGVGIGLALPWVWRFLRDVVDTVRDDRIELHAERKYMQIQADRERA